MNKNKIKKVLGYIFSIFCVLTVVLTSVEVVDAAKEGRPPQVFGYSVSYVPTESMEPEIMAGEYIYYKKTTFDDVDVDDIIDAIERDYNHFNLSFDTTLDNLAEILFNEDFGIDYDYDETDDEPEESDEEFTQRIADIM